ncbi:hypothetical protein M0L20_27115 [Spirosoma sp. RP8]|uniref:DUF6734 domain-containing protein n=1 Tax=Spirosoma liriopis TaxID=2937440 RepID=A0ABT0HTS0_9BACT|nr:DUF6734 family protein [Spirosoma liriopis]MCK8495566.1 hypothetical protein [Spirosoma liriopis]
MKLVQTFWSDHSVTNIDLINGGWLNSRFHLLSWALSSLLLKRNHPDKPLELACDETGKYLLIDFLKLPYDNYKLLPFNTAANHPSYIWITKLLLSYASHDEPFLNIDSDFYAFTKFDSLFLEKDIIVQNKEEGKALFMYKTVLNNLDLSIIPSFAQSASCSVNAGIIGGTCYKLFKDFAESINYFIQSNTDYLDRSDYKDGLNTLLEQYFFSGYCIEKGLQISGLLPAQQHTNYHHLSRLEDLPNNITFVHATLGAKKDTNLCELMEYRLRLHFPDEYYSILSKLDSLGLSKNFQRPTGLEHEQFILKGKQSSNSTSEETYHWPRTSFVANKLNIKICLTNSFKLDDQSKKAINSKRLLQSVFIYERTLNKFSLHYPHKSAAYYWTLRLINIQLLDELVTLPKEIGENYTVKRINNHVVADSLWQWAHMASIDSCNNTCYEDIKNYKGLYQIIFAKERDKVVEYLMDSLDSIIYSLIKHQLSIRTLTNYVSTFYPDNTFDINFDSIIYYTVLNKIKAFCYLGIIQLYKS